MRCPQIFKGRPGVLRITKKVPGNPGQMSDPACIILGMNNETKYTFVCDPNECDTLIEVTCPSGFDFPSGIVQMTCPCGRKMSYISATIRELTNERNPMTTSSFTTEEQVTALQEKINNLEGLLESYQRQLTSSSANYNELRSQINRIIDNMTYDYWYNPNTESEDRKSTRLNSSHT